MAAKIDQKCNENDTDYVEMDLACECIDPAVGSVINNILFGYRFDKVFRFSKNLSFVLGKNTIKFISYQIYIRTRI